MRHDLADQGITLIASVTGDALVAHLTSLKQDRGMEASSIARHLAAIRMLFRWLTGEGKLDENPASLLERPSLWQKVPGVLSPGAVKRLLAAPRPPYDADEKTLPLWIRDRALLELLYACGLRASEAATLTLDDLLPAMGVLKVTGKGDKQRLVPFGRPAEEAIGRYLDECRPRLERGDGREQNRLLLSRTGRPLERVSVWHIVKKHARTAGLDDAYPHLIRHSFATHLLAGGADLRVVQELLGHANITTTQVYTRVDQSRLREVLRRYHPSSQ
jgi:integrase/recombinase XerD